MIFNEFTQLRPSLLSRETEEEGRGNEYYALLNTEEKPKDERKVAKMTL